MSTTPSPEADPARKAAEEIFAGYEHKEGLRCHGELAPNSFGWFRRTKESATAIIQRHYGSVIAEKDRQLKEFNEKYVHQDLLFGNDDEIADLRAQLATAQAAAETAKADASLLPLDRPLSVSEQLLLRRCAAIEMREFNTALVATQAQLDAANKRADAAEHNRIKGFETIEQILGRKEHETPYEAARRVVADRDKLAAELAEIKTYHNKLIAELAAERENYIAAINAHNKTLETTKSISAQLTASRTALEETRRAGVTLREALRPFAELVRKHRSNWVHFISHENVSCANAALAESRALDAKTLGGDDIAGTKGFLETPVIPSDPASRAVTPLDATQAGAGAEEKL